MPLIASITLAGVLEPRRKHCHSLIGETADNEFLMPSLRRMLIEHTRIAMTFYNPRRLALALQRELAADQHEPIHRPDRNGGCRRRR